MKKTPIKRINLVTILVILTLFTYVRTAEAQSSFVEQSNAYIEQDEYIQAFNGGIESVNLVRGQTVNIFATLGNFGDQTLNVVSLNADFKHMDGNSRFDYNYTVDIDTDYRQLGAGDTFTATIIAEINNIEAKYNLTIFFVAEDVYDTSSDLGAPARDYIAAQNITVSVIDLGSNSSATIVGLGITFAAIVVGIIALILYGWLKEKIAKRKYK